MPSPRSSSRVLFHLDNDDAALAFPASSTAVPSVAQSGEARSVALDGSAMSNRKTPGTGLAAGLLASSSPGPHSVYELAAGENAASSSSLASSSDSGSSSSLTPSLSSRRRRRRLPQSGLTLCGRRWLLGAEDMCVPAGCSSFFDLALLVLAAVCWRLLYTSEYPPSCTSAQQSELESWVGMHVIAYGVLLAADIATMLSSLTSNMFERNRTIVMLIYLRLAATIIVVCVTLAANITYFHSLRTACAGGPEHSGNVALHHLLLVLFLTSLCGFLVFGSYFLCAYGFGPLCGKGTQTSWFKHIQRWLLCYTPAPSADGRNVLESISEIFTAFFAADRAAALADAEAAAALVGEGSAAALAAVRARASVHIVPSDILVGFALVEASQKRRAMHGHQFLHAAPRNRWSADAFKPHGVAGVAPPSLAAQAATDVNDQFQVSYGATTTTRSTGLAGGDGRLSGNQAAPRTHSMDPMQGSIAASSFAHGAGANSVAPSSPPDASPDPLPAAARGLWETARASAARSAALAPEERAESNLSTAAGLGLQPLLDPRDWQKVADAKHFSKFSEASYGWPLFVWNNPSCLLTCKACRCCTRSRFAHEHMVGSGCGLCGGTRCCHWSLSSFLLTTGVADSDLIYAHLDSSPIYYLTTDHHQQCLVICCRGTLSVADAVIDLDAKLSPMDSYGYPGSYTHTGILENALRLRDDLDERGHMRRFLEQHPHYNITVVGHSLGAATAALLTLLLRERYDTGPPPVQTSGALNPHTRNRLTCISYGCPLLVSLDLAHSEFALRCMTTIVYGSDVICRLSLASCALLKDQMIASFAVSSTSKFRILANSVRAKYANSFEPGADLASVASPSGIVGQEDGDNVSQQQLQQQQSSTYGLGSSSSSSSSLAQSAPLRGVSGSESRGVAGGGSGGDISEHMLLGSVAKALGAMDALPEEASNDMNGPRELDADERAAITRAPSEAERLTATDRRRLSAPNLDAASGSPRLQSDGSGHALPQIPSVIVTAPVPAAAAAAAAAVNSSAAAPASPTSPLIGTAPAVAASASSSSATAAASSSASASFTLHLRKCYLPGRIYHVLPGARPPSDGNRSGLCFRRPPRPSVVYPAAQSSFQEIIVSKSMFQDHMPHLYALHNLRVPDTFYEARDEEEAAAVSPPPRNVGQEHHLEGDVERGNGHI